MENEDVEDLNMELVATALNLGKNEFPALVITTENVDEDYIKLNILSKLDKDKIIFILQETLTSLTLNPDHNINENKYVDQEEQTEVILPNKIDFIESDQSLLSIDPNDMLNGSIIDPIKSDK